MFVNFLSKSNWLAALALVLGAVLILRGHGVEDNSMLIGGFALARVEMNDTT